MSPKSIPTVFANNNQKNIQQGEHAIGLELFANTLSGFPATFKTLNSDFIVQEITETGEVCSLTELEPLVDRAARVEGPQQQQRGNHERDGAGSLLHSLPLTLSPRARCDSAARVLSDY